MLSIKDRYVRELRRRHFLSLIRFSVFLVTIFSASLAWYYQNLYLRALTYILIITFWILGYLKIRSKVYRLWLIGLMSLSAIMLTVELIAWIVKGGS